MKHEELESYKKQYKNKIQNLIESNLLNEAKDLISAYEEIIQSDIEIYSFKAVINILEGDMESAELILKEALEIDSNNFDILYNLAYIYENQEKYISSYRNYKKAFIYSDKDIKDSIANKIIEIDEIEIVKEYNKRKKVLFIAHIFPPVGGSGVQRSLKFVKYLRDFGWEPIVITVGNTRYPLRDETMISEIPSEIEIVRINEGMQINKEQVIKQIQLYRNIISNNSITDEYIDLINNSLKPSENLLLVPDPYILWATQVLDKIEYKVDLSEIDMIYTTSGPYSDHMIGYILKSKYNIPFVADFRDEWSNNPMIVKDENSTIYKLNYHLEKGILSFADKIITAAEVAKENYVRIFSLEKNKISTITNGYDENDFKSVKNNINKNEKFTIMHNGLLYGNRSAIPFINVIKNLIDKGLVNKDDIVVYFTLTDCDEKYIEYTKVIGLEKNIKFIGYLNHLDSLKKSNEADLLLLIIGEGEMWKGVYSGKIFEYLRLGKPIISLSPKNSIVENLINTLERGRNFEFNELDEIGKYILDNYINWKEDLKVNLPMTDNIIKYERKYLTNKLADVFNELQH